MAAMAIFQGAVVARYDYDASDADEVSVRVGEIGQVTQKVSDDWWLVAFEARVGLVPSNYVTEVVSEAVAEFDYAAQDDTEVNFAENDRILVLEKLDADWWIGQVNNMQGMFPSAYVKEFPLPVPQPFANQPKQAMMESGKNMKMTPQPVMPQPAMMEPEPEAEPEPAPEEEMEVEEEVEAPKQMMGINPLAVAAQGVKLRKTGRENKEKEVTQVMAVPSSTPINMRASMADRVKMERIEMMQKEVMMMAQLEKDLTETKDLLSAAKQEMTSMKTKWEKEVQDLKNLLAESEQNRSHAEKRAQTLEQDLDKQKKDMTMMRANEESAKVKELKEEIQRQFEQTKQLRADLTDRDETIKRITMEKDNMCRTMTNQMQDLQKKISSSAMEISQLKASASLGNSAMILACGQLCMQINGQTIAFNVTQADDHTTNASSSWEHKEVEKMKPMKDENSAAIEKPVLKEEKPVMKDEQPMMMDKPVIKEPKPTMMVEKPMLMAKEDKPVMPEKPTVMEKPTIKEKRMITPPMAEPVMIEEKQLEKPAMGDGSKTVPRRPAPDAKPKVGGVSKGVPIVAMTKSSQKPEEKRPSYAEKTRASLDGLKCELCTVEQCPKFTPNQFKPHLCGTCRHNKSLHK